MSKATSTTRWARDDLPVAEGSFVHVFVDRQTRRPWQVGAELRATLQTLLR
jgi:acyl-CoA thioester hydrolase